MVNGKTQRLGARHLWYGLPCSRHWDGWHRSSEEGPKCLFETYRFCWSPFLFPFFWEFWDVDFCLICCIFGLCWFLFGAVLMLFEGYKSCAKQVRIHAEKEGFPKISLREIRLLKRLRHPNIVELLEVSCGRPGMWIGHWMYEQYNEV